MDGLNTCGCKSCGGPQARADALAARRVVAFAEYVRRGAPAAELANRSIRPGLFERLVMGKYEVAR